MREGCPPRTALLAFSSGDLSGPELEAMEVHLANCLDCARQLDTITQQQLSDLGSDPLIAHPKAASPAVAKLIETACAGFPGSHQSAEAAVRAALDPPAREGSIGNFAGYDILEIAGSGGMGVVLKAHDPTLHRDVALKILSPARACDEESATRFLREARTIASLQHDNVVAIYSAGREKGLPYLVMPFHAEGTLEQWLQKTPGTTSTVVARIGIQLARALAATHGKGVLHRDIKPSNVLLEVGLDRVRLADFGLAQPVEDNATRERQFVAGTPHYMSPEQARGEPIDARSDLFGLGALLYQLATSRTPYEGNSAKDVLQDATSGETRHVREVNPKVPVALAEVIDRLLAPRPENRFASAEAAAKALELFANRAGRYWRWTRRTAVSILAACLALVATILVLDWTGQTVIINTFLCERTGGTCYLRGRFGTFSDLPEAVAAARSHDVIEARFSGEQLTASFRVGGRPLTIRAAKGFMPILVATNNAQPMILADAPLTLEGLTLWRLRTPQNFAALVSVEKAPLHLLNCRLLRSRFQGQNVLVRGRLLVTPGVGPQRYRALLAFQHGSSGYLRNCLVIGTQASAVELRASAEEPTRVEVENSLFVTDHGFYLNLEARNGVSLKSTRSVFVTGALLDFRDNDAIESVKATWEDCLVDRAGGALLRIIYYRGGDWLRALDWRETNVVYAGQGNYLATRRRRVLESEIEWNEALRLGTNSHAHIDQQAFAETVVRSALTLQAADFDPQVVGNQSGHDTGFEPGTVGEGSPYEEFRRTPEYRAWRKQVRDSVNDWEHRRVARKSLESR